MPQLPQSNKPVPQLPIDQMANANAMDALHIKNFQQMLGNKDKNDGGFKTERNRANTESMAKEKPTDAEKQ